MLSQHLSADCAPPVAVSFPPVLQVNGLLPRNEVPRLDHPDMPELRFTDEEG